MEIKMWSYHKGMRVTLILLAIAFSISCINTGEPKAFSAEELAAYTEKMTNDDPKLKKLDSACAGIPVIENFRLIQKNYYIRPGNELAAFRFHSDSKGYLSEAEFKKFFKTEF